MSNKVHPTNTLSEPSDPDAVNYERLLKLNQTAIFTLDADLIITHAIGAYQTLTGLEPDTLVGKPYCTFVSADWCTNIEHAIQSNPQLQLEYPLIQGDALQWVQHTSERIDNDDTYHYDVMIRAIETPENDSERKRTLLDALPDMILVVAQDGTISEFHTSPDAKLLDLDESIIGQAIQDAKIPQPLVDETLLFLNVDLFDYVQSIEFAQDEQSNASEHFEGRLIRLNKQEIIVMIRNVTSIRRVQDELNRHIEDLNLVRQVNVELSTDLDIDTVSLLAMDAALRLSNAQAGYLAMKQPTGVFNVLSQFGSYNQHEIERALLNREGVLDRVLQKGQPELILNVADDAEYAPLLEDTHAMMVIPLRAKEDIVGVLVLEARTDDRFSRERFQFLQLITGRIAAFLDNAMLHRQKEEQYQEVLQLEQLKTDMIRIANHDLKNPIAGIMGYMELLRYDINDKLNEREQGYLDKIEVAAKKMQRITTGILSLERIQQLSDQQILKKVNLNKLVKQSVSEQMDFAVRSEQKLHRHLPEETISILGDPLQLHEAISNLVQNAIKYTDKGGEVNVTLEEKGGYAYMRVVDNGYGIPDNQKDRLFDPFYRVRTKETRYIDGTGLGLHLVKNIIERHNGEMIFESEYGTGSTFGFIIPTMLGGAMVGA